MIEQDAVKIALTQSIFPVLFHSASFDFSRSLSSFDSSGIIQTKPFSLKPSFEPNLLFFFQVISFWYRLSVVRVGWFSKDGRFKEEASSLANHFEF